MAEHETEKNNKEERPELKDKINWVGTKSTFTLSLNIPLENHLKLIEFAQNHFHLEP